MLRHLLLKHWDIWNIYVQYCKLIKYVKFTKFHSSLHGGCIIGFQNHILFIVTFSHNRFKVQPGLVYMISSFLCFTWFINNIIYWGRSKYLIFAHGLHGRRFVENKNKMLVYNIIYILIYAYSRNSRIDYKSIFDNLWAFCIYKSLLKLFQALNYKQHIRPKGNQSVTCCDLSFWSISLNLR